MIGSGQHQYLVADIEYAVQFFIGSEGLRNPIQEFGAAINHPPLDIVHGVAQSKGEHQCQNIIFKFQGQ